MDSDVEKDLETPPPSRGRSISRPSTSRSHRSATQRSRSPSLDLFQREKLTPYPVPDQQPAAPSIDTLSRPSFELEPLSPTFLKPTKSTPPRPPSPYRKQTRPKTSKKWKRMSRRSSTSAAAATAATNQGVRKPPKAAVMAPPITYPNGTPPPYANPWDEEAPLWDKRAVAQEIIVKQSRRRWQYAAVAGVALVLVVVAVVAPLIYVHRGKGANAHVGNEIPGA